METVFYFPEHDHYFDAQGRIMGQAGNDGFNRILPFYSSEILWLILFGINIFVFVVLAVLNNECEIAAKVKSKKSKFKS